VREELEIQGILGRSSWGRWRCTRIRRLLGLGIDSGWGFGVWDLGRGRACEGSEGERGRERVRVRDRESYVFYLNDCGPRGQKLYELGTPCPEYPGRVLHYSNFTGRGRTKHKDPMHASPSFFFFETIYLFPRLLDPRSTRTWVCADEIFFLRMEHI